MQAAAGKGKGDDKLNKVLDRSVISVVQKQMELKCTTILCFSAKYLCLHRLIFISKTNVLPLKLWTGVISTNDSSLSN